MPARRWPAPRSSRRSHLKHWRAAPNVLIVSPPERVNCPNRRDVMKQIPASKASMAAGFSMLRSATVYPDCAGGEQLRNALLDRGANEFVPLERADADPAPAWDALAGPARRAAAGLSMTRARRPPTSRCRSPWRWLRLTPGPRLTETWQLGFEPRARPGLRRRDLLLISPRPDAPPRCYSIGSSSRWSRRSPPIRLTVSLRRWRDEVARRASAKPAATSAMAWPSAIASKRRCDASRFQSPEVLPVRSSWWRRAPASRPSPGFLAERAVAPDCGELAGSSAIAAAGATTSTHQPRAASCVGTLAHLDTARPSRMAPHRRPADRARRATVRWLERENGVLYMRTLSRLQKSVERALLEIIRDQRSQTARQAEDLLVETDF